jgi:phosphoglycerol transferase MdoB-like AlkP superfamily enzyme
VRAFRYLEGRLSKKDLLSPYEYEAALLVPAIFSAAAATFVWVELSRGVFFWLVAGSLLLLWSAYFRAFIAVHVRQRDELYQREEKPLLSKEYKDG